MSKKRSELSQSQIRDKELEIKHKMFERLSQKGLLQSIQQQMRRAIAQELNDSSKTLETTEPKSDNKVSNGVEDKTVDNIEDKEFDPLTKVSAVANWEKQIRYELEIDKEIQCRELERQRERLRNESRKLDQRDKSLRIELDARERKIRLREEELQTNIEELNQRLSELSTKEQMIESIVSEKIKSEMKEEIEKLRKKFNELEDKDLSLNKREDKVKEVEQRLHEQVKIVKEKIDNKRLSEIELAKSRKDLEIIKKENEVLKQRVESMEDYHLTKFENKSLKNELNAIKESLKNKTIELEFEREKLDKIIKQNDEKVLNLKLDLRKRDQELLLLKQKHQGDIDQYENQTEQFKTQLKQSKLALQQIQQKNHLLSKEIISVQNVSQKMVECKQTLSNNLIQTDGQKYGCYICDHNIKTMEESSLEFLVSQKCISNQKTDLFDEHKNWLSPKNPSISCDNNEENGLKIEENQTSVPFKTLIKRSDAIKNRDICAKHDIHSKQTNEDKQKVVTESEDIKTGHTSHLNGFNKHKTLTNYSQDFDNDISDTFEW